MNPEADALEATAAWRLRRVDADPSDAASAEAARLLEALAADLRGDTHPDLWTEFGAVTNWLGESGAIDDFAALAGEYRARIGVSAMPRDGADYLRALLAIARGLV